jgi:hypothetical protein
MLGFCGVSQLFQIQYRVSVQGRAGSVELRQAAGNLTPLWVSQRREETALEEVAGSHVKLIVILNSAQSLFYRQRSGNDTRVIAMFCKPLIFINLFYCSQ